MSAIVLIGPPGAGKGTQRERVLKENPEYGFIVPGDIMRAEISNGTKMGNKLKKYLNDGLLAPHDLVMASIDKHLTEYKRIGKNKIIFDGFPRMLEQAVAIDQILANYGDEYKIQCVIVFEVSDDNIMKRIHNRSLTSNRADDKEDTIICNRIKLYKDNITPIINHYRGFVYSIDGNADLDTVYESLKEAVNKSLCRSKIS